MFDRSRRVALHVALLATTWAVDIANAGLCDAYGGEAVCLNCPPLTPAPTAAVCSSGNIVLNPSGEEGISQWVALNGSGLVAFSGTVMYADGTHVFATVAPNRMWQQDLALPSCWANADVDAGKYMAVLDVKIGGTGFTDDSVNLTLHMLDGYNQRLSSLQLGPYTGFDRLYIDSVFPYAAATAVPPGTRHLTMVMAFVGLDGWCDAIDVRIVPVTAAPTPPTPTPTTTNCGCLEPSVSCSGGTAEVPGTTVNLHPDQNEVPAQDQFCFPQPLGQPSLYCNGIFTQPPVPPTPVPAAPPTPVPPTHIPSAPAQPTPVPFPPGLCNVSQDCPPAFACTTYFCASGQCIAVPRHQGIVCRELAGVCDQEELCDGTTFLCPTDTFVVSGVTCDFPECGTDADVHCDGTSAVCPVTCGQCVTNGQQSCCSLSGTCRQNPRPHHQVSHGSHSCSPKHRPRDYHGHHKTDSHSHSHSYHRHRSNSHSESFSHSRSWSPGDA